VDFARGLVVVVGLKVEWVEVVELDDEEVAAGGDWCGS